MTLRKSVMSEDVGVRAPPRLEVEEYREQVSRTPSYIPARTHQT